MHKSLSAKMHAPTRHANNIVYDGIMSEYQLYGKSEYQNRRTIELNKYQKLLYERAMFGLGVYTEEEIYSMSKEKRKRISQVHKRTKRVINLWKQELLIKLSDSLFEKYFPRMPFTSSLKNFKSDPLWHCSMKLEDFGVKKEQVIVKLVKEGILPHDFFELKTAA